MVMDRPFTTASEQLVNFNWQDIFKGVGYISYYCCAATDNSATTYFLTPTIQEAFPAYEQTTGTIDRDYDLIFDKEEDIEGDFIINLTQRPGSAGAAGTCNTAIVIYHVDTASGETSLGTATTPTRSGSGPHYRENLQINISRKHFSPGEKLRINVRFTGSANTGRIYVDPSSSLTNTDNYGRTVGSDLIVQIPFKIEQ